MTATQTKSFAHLAEAVIAAFSAADWAQLRAMVAPNVVYTETGTQRRVENLADYLQLLQGWKQAIPDAQGIVHKAVSQGNTAVLELTWGGHRRDLYRPQPASCRHRGRRFAYPLPLGIPLTASWSKKFTTISTY